VKRGADPGSERAPMFPAPSIRRREGSLYGEMSGEHVTEAAQAAAAAVFVRIGVGAVVVPGAHHGSSCRRIDGLAPRVDALGWDALCRCVAQGALLRFGLRAVSRETASRLHPCIALGIGTRRRGSGLSSHCRAPMLRHSSFSGLVSGCRERGWANGTMARWRCCRGRAGWHP